MCPASSPAALIAPAEWGVGEPVTTAVFALLSDDELLGEVETIERITAWLAARSVSVVGELSRRRERDAVAALDGDASPRAQSLARVGAREAVVDEVVLATGLGQRAVQTRIDLARKDERHRWTREALAAGRLSWSRVLQVHDKTSAVDPHRMRGVLEQVLAPWQAPADDDPGDDGGLAVPQGVFSWRLGRAVAAATTSKQRHREAIDRRDLWAAITPDADGNLTVTGDAARIAAATGRVETIARRLRKEGDSRSLAHLRSDIALDLLQHGQLADSLPEGATAAYATFAGELPPARVDVTISAASLLGVSNEPGAIVLSGRETHLPARMVRDIAYRAGSTWRRIVTDPATGYMADVTRQGYAITGELRERVFARDRHSRVPGSTRPAALCDTDHDIDYADGGPTSESNASSKHRRGHNHKTHKRWTSRREPEVHGSITWTTGTGRNYTTTPFDHRDPTPTRDENWRALRAYLASRAMENADPDDDDDDDYGSDVDDGKEAAAAATTTLLLALAGHRPRRFPSHSRCGFADAGATGPRRRPRLRP
ncbi:HNH endonuclease signature motif containing protein [Mobilicoccus caccae]|uniref:HNH endonuclease n=1 Tax=Mobilicoccus caccae TaxID=1859295 RepID=A0ABQ6IWC6_9MICO|nr:HNH endonuclease signature motif containing protein [Mobilicoccus caccae]GMA41447.1 HNH endonuclease [Mobilicoccus caccae]